MLKCVVAAAVSAALIAMPAASVLAQAPQASEASEAQPAKPVAAKKQPGAGFKAARERQKKCGAEWKDAKAAGTVAKDMKWPKYWSECNKRLKAQGT
jgi:hypothetical protein